jgi:protein tyrosine phosphatase (PTP) superfamily phosphohydrolase (DUF442 family)
MLGFIFSSVFLFGSLCPHFHPRPTTYEVIGQDQTEAFTQAFKEFSAGSFEDWSKLRKYKVILVPGFLSDQISRLDFLPDFEWKSSPPFSRQIEWLKKEEVEYEYLQIATQKSIEFNLPAIRKALSESEKPVIFFTHSRGGLDVLEVLLTADRKQKAKVRGWVAFQSPFQGTPMADQFLLNPALQWTADNLLHIVQGDLQCVKDMSSFERKAYLKRQEQELQQLLARIPVLSLGTWKPNLKGIDTSLEIQRDFLERLGYETDGLIPWQSAILPGSNYVFLKGVDHTSTIHSESLGAMDSVLLAKSFFKILTSMMR